MAEQCLKLRYVPHNLLHLALLFVQILNSLNRAHDAFEFLSGKATAGPGTWC